MSEDVLDGLLPDSDAARQLVDTVARKALTAMPDRDTILPNEDTDLRTIVDNQLHEVATRLWSLTLPRAATVEVWNRRYPVGTCVRYWPGAKDNPGTVSVTSSAAWTLGDGTAVVSVEGYVGGIALTHVVPYVESEDRSE